jgi:hypothetical protein
MAELWEWVCAAAAHDFGDPGPMAAMLRSEPLPAEFRAMVADIVSGARALPKRAPGLAPGERLKIAAALQVVTGLTDAIRKSPDRERTADRLKMEPIEIVREMEQEKRAIRAEAAADLGVSVETVENLVRDLRRRIDRWPVV